MFPAWAESVVYQSNADSAHVLKRLNHRPKPAGRAVQLWLMKLFPNEEIISHFYPYTHDNSDDNAELPVHVLEF